MATAPLMPYLVLRLVVEVFSTQVQHFLHLEHVTRARVGTRVQHHLSVSPHAVLDRLHYLSPR